jgi:hypothetical protein
VSSTVLNSSIGWCRTGPGNPMPALFTKPFNVPEPSDAWTAFAAAATAASSRTSNRSGVNDAPNSSVNRSASASFLTPPNTRQPWAVANFATAWPIPVEAPVTASDRGAAVNPFLPRLLIFWRCQVLPSSGAGWRVRRPA